MTPAPDRIILPIKPESWVRIKSGKGGDHVLFNIPEVCIKGDDGQACPDYVRDGLCSHTLSKAGRYRKRRIERYNEYRLNLFMLAKNAGFQLPTCGFCFYFYFPCPKSWTKKKKEIMHGQMHLAKPDYDNCAKAASDSLTTQDSSIGQVSGIGKFWFHPDKVEPRLQGGYVEILLNQPVYNPFSVELIDRHRLIPMENIQVSRDKRNARKAEMKAIQKAKKKAGIDKERTPKPLKLIPQEKLFKKSSDLLK